MLVAYIIHQSGSFTEKTGFCPYKATKSSFANPTTACDTYKMSALKLPHASKGITWSDETVQTALRIRSATGVRGYNFIRNLHFPLPSYRTLCNRVMNLQLQPGIQSMILDWMEMKMVDLHPQEKLCSLLLDEVQTGKSVEYDPSLKRFVGYISPEFATPSDNIASHVLCYMVKGMTTKWKQLVAYFYTGTSVNGEKLWDVTKNIIVELGKRGFIVNVVVSDMGSSNQGMWKAAGVISNRDVVKCKIPHPCFGQYQLHFMADVPHLLKNIRSAFLKHKMVLPAEIVAKMNLPTPQVDSSHVTALINEQENKELKLAPRLTPRHVNPSHYEKMRVNMAAQVLSHETASALRTLVRQKILPASAETTAFFCELIHNWFKTMNCRHRGDALFPNSVTKIDQLREVLSIAQRIKISGSWKPVQSGLKLSVSSLLSLHHSLVANGDMCYLMSGRLTQDALENLFSQVRGFGNTHPKPIQFRAALKLITLGQLMDVPASCSYDDDETPHLLSFLKDHVPSDDIGHIEREVTALDALLGVASPTLDVCEGNGLYYIVGWTLFKEIQGLSCDKCKNAFMNQSTVVPQLPEALLSLFKSYNPVTHNLTPDHPTMYLCHPSAALFHFFQTVEGVFRVHVSDLHKHPCPESVLLQQATPDVHDFPVCHGILPKLMKRFLKLRLHIHAKFVSSTLSSAGQHGSKSAARAHII